MPLRHHAAPEFFDSFSMSLEFMSCRGDLKRCRTVFHHVQAFAAVVRVHRQQTHARAYIYIYIQTYVRMCTYIYI